MVKSCFGVVCGVMILSVIPAGVPLVAAAVRSPASLVCVRNAYAGRGYGFDEKRWLGILTGSEPSSNPPFEISITGKSGPKADVTLERIFSGLDGETPNVREIEKGGRGDKEFSAKLLSRLGDSVIILWGNSRVLAGANWIWLAHIDLRRRVAVVTSVYDGMTYSGGELETLDCR